MQQSLTYRTNRDLFSNHYLDEHLPETEAWEAVDDGELRAAREGILDLYESEKGTAPKRNESQLEEKFIRPMFRKLSIPFEVEESTSRTQRRPDYGFFESEDAARNAFERRETGGDFYEDAVAVADAKRWGRPLDTRGNSEHERDFENPSYQIHVYLQETPARWAVLTDGKTWRLYYGPTSHRLDSYYEIDLPTVLEEGDLEAFKYFYLFFRHEAFLKDAGGDCFLDGVYDESNVFARDLGEDLQDNIYEAIKVLSEGFLQYPENDLDESDLDLVHDASLIYLYRLIFVLYAEAEGRDLLDTDNEIYEQSYSLNALKQEVAAELDGADPKYRDWQDDLSSRLDELFELIDRGSRSRGIPEEDLYIPAYNGGLFRTDPDADDGPEARFLAAHTVGDAHLARVVELLTRSEQANGGGKIFVDYSSLDVRHLGSIYEGLLEYQLHVADGPLTVEDGEYSEAEEGEEVVVEAGEVYLTTGSGERKATGSYYTPEYVVEYIVDETLGPLVDDIREDLVGQTTYRKGDEEAGTFADEFADRVFDLTILDPAMGSGHFLTSAVDYLAREIIDAQERQAAQQGIETVAEDRDINWARRKVAQRCIYGVDLNPLATELAKVSLWLRTLAAEQPLAFLDHHLKTGNSLVGSDIEDVLSNGEGDGTTDGQLTLQQSFAHTRQQALEHVMDRFQDLLSIDNETLEDAKEMEDVYDAVRDDPLYQHLLAMANVHTAERFGVDVPDDAHERMAEALRDESWADIEGQDWFESAQATAEEERFFHWELEFPVAFYDEDGDRKPDAGFDAVIGNPPYISIVNLEDAFVQYFKRKYESANYGRTDIYLPFIEKGIEIADSQGRSSMIVPDKWLVSDYGETLRTNVLRDNTVEQIVDLRSQNVFSDATNSPIIYLIKNQKSQTKTTFYSGVPGWNYTGKYSISQNIFKNLNDNKIIIGLTEEEWDVCLSLREKSWIIDDFMYVSYGAQPGLLSKFVLDSRDAAIEQCKSLGYGDIVESVVEPFIKGRHIRPYSINHGGEYLVYLPDELHRPAFRELFDLDKIAMSEVATTLKAAFDEEGYYGNETVVFLVKYWDLFAADVDRTGRTSFPNQSQIPDSTRNINMNYITTLLNSKLLEFYFESTMAEFLHVYPDDIRELPIYKINMSKSVQSEKISRFRSQYNTLNVSECIEEQSGLTDRETHDVLAFLGEELAATKKEKREYNLTFLDYLGNYEAGPNLPDIGLFQPTRSNILDATAEEYENLRVGEVRAERDSTSVTVSATARYKPDDEDAHETDTYGYTETDFFEAFTLVDLTENEAALVEAFVPVAVEEAGGFAGFRENATKTNSLLDRLKAITLPDPDDVADDLRRYVETKDRADELDARIEKTDELIDEIVYDLYDLTDEEIEIVEEAVGE
ncbi:Eco57I restriction-modification methylase domain-containing protein [Halorubrum rubrum]|uniref:site-specific DNA-methyltransferase (adenine-specific) n=1 Tax=Halorubrum rubrum TaxID=1126240 RepID=A0ABD5R3P3_9EURY|nr:TaqI-like C-terminal specificity domain-containing protein [Halorubrum rubrum]